MKTTLLIIFCLLIIAFSTSKAHAVYDPRTISNNAYGIHILFPEEVSEASTLVNSSGGDWGYVTIPIKVSDRDIVKWQKFMDECYKYHLIPILRIATEGDYFSKASWSKPSSYDILDFANFLDSLNWPVKNKYIIVFNEVNRGDEWGGTPDPIDYANILDYATSIFKERSRDYFIISSGFDNASINIPGQSVNELTFMRQMETAVPGIFNKIDGISSHSYPNPGFASAPNSNRVGVSSFIYQNQLIKALTGKELPVFITETGWSSDKISYDTQDQYYKDTFNNYWNNPNIVAVTPFIFKSEQEDFLKFSFIKSGAETPLYKSYKSLPKQKGIPILNSEIKTQPNVNILPKNEIFDIESSKSIIKQMNESTKSLFKWILRI